MNRADFEEWLKHPVTVAFFKSLAAEATETMKGIGVYNTVDETALKAARAKGTEDGLLSATQHVPVWAKEPE